MSRKGQGISINMVILTAIALLVLVVAVILITKAGKNADTNAGTGSCLAQGGVCKDVGTQATTDSDLGQLNCPADQHCYRYNFGG